MNENRGSGPAKLVFDKADNMDFPYVPLAESPEYARTLLCSIGMDIDGDLAGAIGGMCELHVRMLAGMADPGYRGRARVVLGEIGPRGGMTRVYAQSCLFNLADEIVSVPCLDGKTRSYGTMDPELGK